MSEHMLTDEPVDELYRHARAITTIENQCMDVNIKAIELVALIERLRIAERMNKLLHSRFIPDRVFENFEREARAELIAEGKVRA